MNSSADPTPAGAAEIQFVDLTLAHPLWEQAFPVLAELRPELTREQLDQVIEEGARERLSFLGAFSGPICLAVTGWRLMATTSVLRKLYVDDLVTASNVRSSGVGGALLAELERRAREAGCLALELDSGVQRYGAHRFYLRERMDIQAHHFRKSL